LDGIPLAIELAAARLRVFTVEQVAARLGDRFRLLTGGSRTALPGQQTLRALIDWSYDLLDEEERDLFRRLSVFMGGWAFAAAESVADPLDVYTLLPQLVSKSLVAREGADWRPVGDMAGAGLETRFLGETEFLDDAEPRYFYLETIRQYARDRLVESGAVESARVRVRRRRPQRSDAVGACYETLSESVDFGGGPGAAVLRGGRITLEQDNLRAAVEWGDQPLSAPRPDPHLEPVPLSVRPGPGLRVHRLDNGHAAATRRVPYLEFGICGICAID
jgi:predicted ATPase